MFRQGDVLLLPVPEGTLAALEYPHPHPNGLILARGEATGHAHVVDGRARAIVDYSWLYLQVEEPAVLRHEEHAPIELPVGVYEVRRQREYGIGNVAD